MSVVALSVYSLEVLWHMPSQLGLITINMCVLQIHQPESHDAPALERAGLRWEGALGGLGRDEKQTKLMQAIEPTILDDNAGSKSSNESAWGRARGGWSLERCWGARGVGGGRGRDPYFHLLQPSIIVSFLVIQASGSRVQQVRDACAVGCVPCALRHCLLGQTVRTTPLPPMTLR